MGKLIFFLLIMGMGAVQAITKAAKEKNRNQRVQGGNDPGRKRRVQSEIESFLAEVTGTAPKPKSRAKSSQTVDERRKRRRQQAEAKRRQQEQQKQRQQQQKRRAAKRGDRSGSRKVGSGISEHVDEYISQHVAEHIDHDVEEYVEATIVDNVEEHLGDRTTEMPAPTGVARKRNKAAESVAAMLRDPTGVRNAILVNEVLTRPSTRRR